VVYFSLKHLYNFIFLLSLSGRNLEGIHFAMEFLETWQKKQSGNEINYQSLNAAGKDVIVIGGGDTGCDCIATSLRHVSVVFQNHLCCYTYIKCYAHISRKTQIHYNNNMFTHTCLPKTNIYRLIENS